MWHLTVYLTKITTQNSSQSFQTSKADPRTLLHLEQSFL